MIYLDTSFLTPLFRDEPSSQKVEHFLSACPVGSLAISHWTRVEFASVIARDVRMRALGETMALNLLEELDALTKASFHLWHPTRVDFDLAHEFVSEFATKLRGPDALHLAIARNNGADDFLTLDQDMLSAAKRLKIKARRGIRA
jgi:predicted nucleic acid-binding protein